MSARNKRKRRLSKLVRTKVTTLARQERLRPVKNHRKKGFISQWPLNTMSADALNESL